MNEWLLILTMSLMGQPGEIRDISPVFVSGFQTKQTCDSAAAAISDRLVVLSGKARESQGIQSNTRKSAPAIWYECINVKK